MSKLETRVVAVTADELRVEGEPESRKLAGTVITYGKTIDLKWFEERFEAGCFTKYLRENPTRTRALYHHDNAQILASRANDTLRLIDGPDALRFEMDVVKTSYGDDVLRLVEAGEVRGMSFGFNSDPGKENYERTESGRTRRTIVEAALPEITVTSIPAYHDATSVAVRSEGEIDEQAIARAKALFDRPELRTRRIKLGRMLVEQAA